MTAPEFERRYFEDPNFPPGLKGGDEVRGYGYYPDYFPVVEAQLATLIELTGARSLLDVGCGKGALAAYARQHLGVRAFGADSSRYATREARRTAGGELTVCADCARLPFASASFDAVYSNGMLQYLEADAARAALREMVRLTCRAAFISSIAAAQQRSDWGRRDHLTRLYLRPRQWALLLAQSLPPGTAWRAVPLPFEGESAILLFDRAVFSAALPLRFVDLALDRMHRLGALPRMPPGLTAWRAAHSRSFTEPRAPAPG
ncbi:MAG: class I SAM-dependent methyltransferase [Terriglobales bacterium]